jgi:hypothetical protein
MTNLNALNAYNTVKIDFIELLESLKAGEYYGEKDRATMSLIRVSNKATDTFLAFKKEKDPIFQEIENECSNLYDECEYFVRKMDKNQKNALKLYCSLRISLTKFLSALKAGKYIKIEDAYEKARSVYFCSILFPHFSDIKLLSQKDKNDVPLELRDECKSLMDECLLFIENMNKPDEITPQRKNQNIPVIPKICDNLVDSVKQMVNNLSY